VDRRDRQYYTDNVRAWILERPFLSISIAALVALLIGVAIAAAGGDSEAEDLRAQLADVEAEREQLAEDLGAAEEEAREARQQLLAERGRNDGVEPAEREYEEAEQEPEPPADERVVLRVAVQDWTRNNPPAEDAEIWARGHGSWYPDLDGDGGGDVTDMEITGDREFVVYPDGRDGPEIGLRLQPPEDLIAGSVRDMVSVEIRDTRVLVSGTSIPDFDRGFYR
jgi:outer membrane murein-binding lipoprotein Lpp